MTEFPSWRYHATQAPRVFADAASLAAAGEGWVDSPARLVAPVEALPPVSEPVIQPDEAPAGEGEASDGFNDRDKAELHKLLDARGLEYDGRWSRTKLIATLRGE